VTSRPPAIPSTPTRHSPSGILLLHAGQLARPVFARWTKTLVKNGTSLTSEEITDPARGARSEPDPNTSLDTAHMDLFRPASADSEIASFFRMGILPALPAASSRLASRETRQPAGPPQGLRGASMIKPDSSILVCPRPSFCPIRLPSSVCDTPRMAWGDVLGTDSALWERGFCDDLVGRGARRSRARTAASRRTELLKLSVASM